MNYTNLRKAIFLLVCEENYKTIGEAIEESEAKDLLMHSNYDAYAKLYGELEDA